MAAQFSGDLSQAQTGPAALAAGKKSNILFLLADDLGIDGSAATAPTGSRPRTLTGWRKAARVSQMSIRLRCGGHPGPLCSWGGTRSVPQPETRMPQV